MEPISRKSKLDILCGLQAGEAPKQYLKWVDVCFFQ